MPDDGIISFPEFLYPAGHLRAFTDQRAETGRNIWVLI
jgi:hypothetical protein